MKDYNFYSMVEDLFSLKNTYKTLGILQSWQEAVKPLMELLIEFFKDDETKSAVLKQVLD